MELNESIRPIHFTAVSPREITSKSVDWKVYDALAFEWIEFTSTFSSSFWVQVNLEDKSTSFFSLWNSILYLFFYVDKSSTAARSLPLIFTCSLPWNFSLYNIRLKLLPKLKIVFFFFFILTWGHFFIAFRESGRKTGREREKHWCKRGASTGCLPYVPRLGITCAWTGDQTCNLGMCPDPE